MQELIERLKARYPALRFKAGRQFSWSPETSQIIYKATAKGDQAKWSLLHETGHARLGHRSYGPDYELVRLEVAAWQEAGRLASELDIKIDPDHIEDCLDTYRDWLYRRSLCPSCNNKTLQQGDFVHYRCFNCYTVWRVTPHRFHRPYRSTKNARLNSQVNLGRL